MTYNTGNLQNGANSYLVQETMRPFQYPGLIALVSASTRSDKAHRPQAAEIAIEYHLGFSHSVRQREYGESEGIPPGLLHSLVDICMRGGWFDSKETLQPYFLDARIGAWRYRIPEATSPKDRVLKTISYLHNQSGVGRDGVQNGLVLLLRVLRDLIEEGDARKRLLDDMQKTLAKLKSPPAREGTSCLRYCWLIASMGAAGSIIPAQEIKARICDPNGVTTEICEVADPFGIQETYDLVHNIYTQSAPTYSLSPQEIISDFTGGTKPMGTGMLLACSRLRAPMQYMYGNREDIASVPRLITLTGIESPRPQ